MCGNFIKIFYGSTEETCIYFLTDKLSIFQFHCSIFSPNAFTKIIYGREGFISAVNFLVIAHSSGRNLGELTYYIHSQKQRANNARICACVCPDFSSLIYFRMVCLGNDADHSEKSPACVNHYSRHSHRHAYRLVWLRNLSLRPFLEDSGLCQLIAEAHRTSSPCQDMVLSTVGGAFLCQ